MNENATKCAHCGADAASVDRFCEGCGTTMAPQRQIAVPNPAGGVADARPSCVGCGNDTWVDDYCSMCGCLSAGPEREEAVLDAIVVITDRGLEHPRNEDAAAAGILVGDQDHPAALAVAVCDGVSASPASHLAAAAASTAGVAVMVNLLAAGRDTHAAALAGLAEAAKAAAAKAPEDASPDLAPSCTYSAVAVVPTHSGDIRITVANVGDSRAYWLPEPPAAAQCLTVDDSVAQELILAGIPKDAAEVRAGAHTLTRWLGADAGPVPWAESGVRTIDVRGPGILLLCTDGLWNYLPHPDDLAHFFTGAEVSKAATELVEYALRAGGEDNITVAVIPIGGTP